MTSFIVGLIFGSGPVQSFITSQIISNSLLLKSFNERSTMFFVLLLSFKYSKTCHAGTSEKSNFHAALIRKSEYEENLWINEDGHTIHIVHVVSKDNSRLLFSKIFTGLLNMCLCVKSQIQERL